MREFIGYLLVAVAVVFFAIACKSCKVPDDEALDAIEASGVRDVKLGGIDPWRCGNGDSASREFTGVNAHGRPVSGVVCGSAIGCGKGYTIRWTR